MKGFIDVEEFIAGCCRIHGPAKAPLQPFANWNWPVLNQKHVFSIIYNATTYFAYESTFCNAYMRWTWILQRSAIASMSTGYRSDDFDVPGFWHCACMAGTSWNICRSKIHVVDGSCISQVRKLHMELRDHAQWVVDWCWYACPCVQIFCWSLLVLPSSKVVSRSIQR